MHPDAWIGREQPIELSTGIARLQNHMDLKINAEYDRISAQRRNGEITTEEFVQRVLQVNDKHERLLQALREIETL
jgi:hypothetical protein